MTTPPGTDQNIHIVKIAKDYAMAVIDGRKRFEIRKNDRDYKPGDLLIMRVFHPEKGFLPFHPIVSEITYLTDYEQKEGYVVLGIRVYKPEERR